MKEFKLRMREALEHKRLLEKHIEKHKWIRQTAWDRCFEDFRANDLKGQKCWAALDLSKTRKTSSLIFVFPLEHEFYLLPFFWMSRRTANAREQDDPSFSLLERCRHLAVTEGDVLDYRDVMKTCRWAQREFVLKGIAFDPYNATHFALEAAAEGLDMLEFGQTWRNLNEATVSFEKLISHGRIHHNGNPILTLQAGSAELQNNISRQVRVRRPSVDEPEEVGGIIAAIIGLALAQSG